MKTLLPLVCFLLTVLPAEAVLTLRISGNGVGATVMDGGAFDLDADSGEISVDATTLAGWSAGAASFTVLADTNGSTSSSGVVNVQINYDWTGGADLTPIQVAASELFTVQGGPIDYVNHSLTLTETGAGVFPTAVSTNQGFFSTSLPDPGPLDPFDFAQPGTYENEVGFTPPTLVGAPIDLFLQSTGPFTVGGAPGTNFGTRLRVANNTVLSLSGGAIGTLNTSTIVNPEPASMLLSGLGAVLFGFGYYRRQKSRAAEEA